MRGPFSARTYWYLLYRVLSRLERLTSRLRDLQSWFFNWVYFGPVSKKISDYDDTHP